MIIDKNQFDRFIEILPELKNDEIYFISLSARKKYLTEEERVYYSLGRTEMFGRTLVKSKDNFYYAMKKLKSILEYKYTKNHKKIPVESLVVYININPSSMIKASEMFINEINKELFQILQASQNKKQVNYKGFLNMERKLMNCIQKSKSTRHFIDIDIDSNDPSYVTKLKELLTKANIIHYIIKTQGGWHVLIVRETLNNKNIRLHELITDLDNIAKDSNKGEVIFNKNQMIPVPGTLQANKLVEII